MKEIFYTLIRSVTYFVCAHSLTYRHHSKAMIIALMIIYPLTDISFERLKLHDAFVQCQLHLISTMLLIVR